MRRDEVIVRVRETGPFYGELGLAYRRTDGAWVVSLAGEHRGAAIVTRKVEVMT